MEQKNMKAERTGLKQLTIYRSNLASEGGTHLENGGQGNGVDNDNAGVDEADKDMKRMQTRSIETKQQRTL
jgi:hypothetical protein